MDGGFIYAAATLLIGICGAGIAHFLLGWLRKKAEGTKTKPR